MRLSLTHLLVAAALTTSAPACAKQSGNRPMAPQLTVLSEAGNAEARYHLAMIHHLGLEGSRDAITALALFRSAADAGHPLAAYKLGCYYHGQGEGLVQDDPALARLHKTVAANAGYAPSQHDVAMLHYEAGEAALALAWMNKAAAQGWQQSLMALASFYNVGEGIEQDRAKTLAYFKVAQQRGGKPLTEPQRKWLASYERETSAADRQRAGKIAADWKPAPTSLTIMALSGQKAAARLLAASR